MKELKVGMRVRYKPKAHIQTLPKAYRELSVAQDALRDCNISDFVIMHIYKKPLFSGDKGSYIIRIESKRHQKDYNTLAIYLAPATTTIKDGDGL